MGEKYVMPPVISFEAIYEQSTTVTPIVFILSPGSDPAGDLMKLAERSGFGAGKLKYLSLGQGQEKVCDDFEFVFRILNWVYAVPFLPPPKRLCNVRRKKNY